MEEWQLRLQAKNAQLLRTALHDPLTGLANRAAFRSGINTLMNNSDARKTSALLFLDGDNFKYINDTWGHATGDRVLIEIAKRLAEFGGLRHKAYRLGGDEFAMVLHIEPDQVPAYISKRAKSAESARPSRSARRGFLNR